MKKLAFVLLVLLIFSCSKKENKIESILNKMELRLNADNSTMVEADENFRNQGVKRVLNVNFINCKKIDLMDRSLKPEMKILAFELKNNIEGSERIEVYKIKLIKDPNDKTPITSGLNIFEKGFSFYRDDL